MVNTKATIYGLGSYVPERVLSNAELEKMVDTTDEWIVTRTGISERRIAREDEHGSDMGAIACQRALDAAGCSAEEIDLILVGTCTPDYLFPSTAAIIQGAIGAKNAAAFDYQAACTGFICGLSQAKAFVESGIYRTVLLVATEKLSAFVDYTDRATCILFGDGASAAVIRSGGKGFAIDHVNLGADGSKADILSLSVGSRCPATAETVAAGKHYMYQEGREVYKNAVRRMIQSSNECLEALSLTADDVSYMVPHQANLRIIEGVAKRLNFPMEKIYLTVQKYGNTSASSLPLALDELVQKEPPKTGDHLLLTSFGAGLTWGSALITKVDS